VQSLPLEILALSESEQQALARRVVCLSAGSA
jgi:hypothetical protein